MVEPRAVIFDLDDTLYPVRRFVSSGLAVVAAVVADETGATPCEVEAVVRRARRCAPGRELQHVCRVFALPDSDVPRLLDLLRAHRPDISLPRTTARVLAAMRPGWRIGVLTNGRADIQRRKVAALGLTDFVDAVIFASECGNGQGKPDRAAFLTALEQLRVPARRAVVVGDDIEADIGGASRVGIRAIHLRRMGWCGAGRGAARPDARVTSLVSVPRIAARLVEGGDRGSRG